MQSVAASLMRGGTSKGLFFNRSVLPAPGRRRDKILMAAMGSPDRYGKQVDGLGGATSSTSKVMVVGPTTQPNHDLEYLFGQVAIREPFIDYSGNCGNLTAAVASFALREGIHKPKVRDGIAQVTMFQQNIRKTIVAHVPVKEGIAVDRGDFESAGVTFAGAETKIEFLDPANGPVFPTGNQSDVLEASFGAVEATLVNVAMPMVLVNGDYSLEQLQELRALGALKMGLIKSLEDARHRQHTPKIAIVGPAASYTATSGEQIDAQSIDLRVRAVSMGAWHHALMGTGAIAVACASAVKQGADCSVRLGHPSGIVEIGVKFKDSQIYSCTISRSSRLLMKGQVYLPIVT